MSGKQSHRTSQMQGAIHSQDQGLFLSVANSSQDASVLVVEASSVPVHPPAQGGSDCRSAEGNNPNTEHLATDHLLVNLKSRTVSSAVVTGVAQVAQFGLNLVSIMVLARLLMPQDFGLVAMVTTIMGFLRIFSDGGLSTATMQREGITHEQVSNLFWANVALGGFVSVILAASAPVVARFYGEPRLVGITLALCVNFLLTSATVQHMALLKRQIRFKTIGLIQVSSVVVGSLVGIGMAWLQLSYWSLVGIQLSTPAVTFLLTLSASRWRPQLPKRVKDTQSLLSFGANLTASSFMWSVARGVDGLLIGRSYGPVGLGLYSRAQALLIRPVELFTLPFEAVFIPTLSRLQAQPQRYRRIVLQVYDTVALVGFSLAGMLLALAHPLTLVVLGPKWEPAVSIFRGFTLVALYTPVASISSCLLASQGRGTDFLILSSVASLFTVLSFIAGLPFGPVGVATAYSITCVLIHLPLQYYIVGRKGSVTTTDLWSRFFMHLPLSGVVCAVTYLTLASVQNTTALIQLLICVPAGFLAGAVFVCVYPPGRRVALNLFDVLLECKRTRSSRSSDIRTAKS